MKRRKSGSKLPVGGCFGREISREISINKSHAQIFSQGLNANLPLHGLHGYSEQADPQLTVTRLLSTVILKLRPAVATHGLPRAGICRKPRAGGQRPVLAPRSQTYRSQNKHEVNLCRIFSKDVALSQYSPGYPAEQGNTVVFLIHPPTAHQLILLGKGNIKAAPCPAQARAEQIHS